jgi:exosortase family protein XrtF
MRVPSGLRGDVFSRGISRRTVHPARWRPQFIGDGRLGLRRTFRTPPSRATGVKQLLNAGDRKTARFIGVALAAYLVWYVLYQYVLIDAIALDDAIIHTLVLGGDGILALMGEEMMTSATTGWRSRIAIVGSEGALTIGAACDGLVLFALFTVFILAFPGRLARKLWFIPLGIATLHAANLLRVVALTWVHRYHPDALSFNHDYTFTVLVYGAVFALWYVWVEKFAGR